MKVVQFFFLFLISSTFTSAAPHVWVGGNGNWNEPQNWNQGVVPNISDDVIIPAGNGNVDIQAGQKAFARSIHLQNNANLTIFGSLVMKPTGDYGIYCEGKVKMATDAFLEIGGDMYNTLGIWIYNGSFTTNEESEIFLSDLKNGFLIEFGVLSNNGRIHVQQIRNNFSGILIENQGYLYNWNDGRLMFSNMNAVGVNLTYSSSRAYNFGSIQSSPNMHGFLINTSGDAKFYNQKSGEVINESSFAGYAINNYGEIYNKGLIDIRSEARFQNWEGYFHNQSTGHLRMSNPGGNVYSLSASGLNNPSTIINDGWIEIKDVRTGASGIFINKYSDFVNRGLVQISNLESNSKGISIMEGYFKNEGGTIELEADPSERALQVYLDGSFENIDCGELIIESGDLHITGSLTNDAWIYLESDMTDIDILTTNNYVNNGLVVDPFSLLEGLSGFDNQGIVFDPLGPPPVQTGTWIQNALTLGSLANVSFISWHVSPYGAEAGTYLGSSNQLYLYPNAAQGASSLWLTFDFNLGQCGNVWLELPVDGTIQAPPPPPAEPHHQTDVSAPSWRVSPNPASGPVEVLNSCTDCEQMEVLILNGMGQIVDRQSFGNAARLRIERPSGLPTGLYYFQIRSGKQLLHTESMMWQ
jgi:hypothetical protein